MPIGSILLKVKRLSLAAGAFTILHVRAIGPQTVGLIILLATAGTLLPAGSEKQDVLKLIGNRTDKNAVGHGKNLALYTGEPSRYFYATHNLGNIFSAADGKTLAWFPDHTRVQPSSNTNGAVMEIREVFVTAEDVVVSEITLSNLTDKAVTHSLVVTGDCRNSADWREKPGGTKESSMKGSYILMRDRGVYPAALRDGLNILVGATAKAPKIYLNPPGTYRLEAQVELKPGERITTTFACSIGANADELEKHLARALKQRDGLERNADEWRDFFEKAVPRFACSDEKLTELYAFRWFLLRFSTAGGNLGYFKYPVVLEGRQAYQTYCCYSAPFMAFDLNWAIDPKTGFGHIANMAEAAYDDGRFPWYTSPRTNRVQVHHESRTGLSLLPEAAWKHFLIQGDFALLAQLYPSMKKNLEWWIKDRDSDGDGLFQIAHQYETGMDDLHRWGKESMGWRYDAVDATSYAYLNLRAVAQMADVLGKKEDAQEFSVYAEKAASALHTRLWDGKTKSWRDRHPENGQLADVLAITTFYPFFARAAEMRHMDVLHEHLLNPDRFSLPYPVPALAKDQKEFNPDGFWQGPSWPAATTHVLEGFANAAKKMDRNLLPEAAELLKAAAYVHVKPRADFYERYNPLTGQPLSKFRDYMHSWWIDLFIRHIAGLMVEDNGSLVIDPLPMGLSHFSLLGAPFRGKKVDVLWQDPESSEDTKAAGLTVRINGKVALREPKFFPGDDALRVELPEKQ